MSTPSPADWQRADNAEIAKIHAAADDLLAGLADSLKPKPIPRPEVAARRRAMKIMSRKDDLNELHKLTERFNLHTSFDMIRYVQAAIRAAEQAVTEAEAEEE